MALAVNTPTTLGKSRRLALLPVLAFGLSACASGEFFEDVQRYGGPDSVIAKASDSGTDDDPGLVDGEAAIAYDPDGCQVWIIDDGVEGYSSPRSDPRTGLPICDGKYPPGTVLGPYETSTAPGPDYVPR
ncbi:MAG: hypothetical protein V4720_09300 [Pseudomonadota bacterium]|uniref:hypothetical protein n=1 Tax=Tabrizicola sp. TaxID=2005166 RepID=UPI0025EB0500|nr:hypothetical protein [Tabrizicola sp.]